MNYKAFFCQKNYLEIQSHDAYFSNWGSMPPHPSRSMSVPNTLSVTPSFKMENLVLPALGWVSRKITAISAYNHYSEVARRLYTYHSRQARHHNLDQSTTAMVHTALFAMLESLVIENVLLREML